MRSILTALPFAGMTLLCWGVYGPVLHHGSDALGKSSLRAFICVGLAYFFIAVLVPLFILFTKGEKGNWSLLGTIWGFAAGACGAIGALGIISSFKFGGSPVVVMPLVFGSAPVVNTLVSMTMSRTFKDANAIFFAGIVLVALGGAGVMLFAPKATKPHAAVDTEKVAAEDAAAEDAAAPEEAVPAEAESVPVTKQVTYWLFVLAAISTTALCWGSYGTVLHIAQDKLGGSRWRSLLCVGAAYFLIAVLAPIGLLSGGMESGPDQQFTFFGSAWAMTAGAAGAMGALGMILAFNMGGKPIWVMPLVFGGAPVVNTFVKMVEDNLYDQIQPTFIISLLLVVCGAATVLIFSPKPRPKAKGKPGKADEGEGDPPGAEEREHDDKDSATDEKETSETGKAAGK